MRTLPVASRRKLFEHPGRFAIVAIGLTLVACLGAVAILGADTSDQRAKAALPSEIVSVQPQPGTLSKPQESVSVTLRSDLTGVLVIDGHEIPEDQLNRPTQSSMIFQPGPDKDITRFPAGTHQVEVVYWPSIRSRDESRSSTFTFRTTA